MRKKISILINSIAAGGAERVVSLLLKELKDDFDIHLVLLSNTIEYDLPADQKIFYLHQSPGEKGLLKIIKLPFLARRYKKICEKNNIEISLSFLKRANYINCLSRVFGLRSKIIISERTYLSNYLNFVGGTARISGKYLTKKLYPKADLIIANSSLIKTDLQQNFNINTDSIVIYNPVNLVSIQMQGSENVEPSLFKIFTFISVGGFRREKNYDLLVNAFDKIKDLNCTLLLIGKGEEELKLKRKVTEMGLASRIHFPGFDKNPYKYLSKADCFVLSSDFEGFPNSVQEALACDLPVISTDCRSGPREILAPETDLNKNLRDEYEIGEYGILVPENNVEILAAAMRLIFINIDLRHKLKTKARERAKDFDVTRIAEQFKTILLSN